MRKRERERPFVRAGPRERVHHTREHDRDAHYQGAASLGHGKGYRYPHDDPRGWVEQQYLPDEVADRTYYEPSEHGFEGELAIRKRRPDQ